MKPKMKTNKKILTVLICFTMLFTLPQCNTTKTQKKTTIGLRTGAVIDGIIGNKSDHTAAGAIIGATIGGAAGALIGRQMDKQTEELQKDLENATVERIGEGIKITFDSGLMFAIDSYNLNNSTQANLTDLSSVLNKYEDTNILIEGHTDATGETAYNQELSVKRANSVYSYLSAEGVEQNRMTAVGYGESQPIADNNTVENRQLNRRVEVAIYANERMKRAAKRGEI